MLDHRGAVNDINRKERGALDATLKNPMPDMQHCMSQIINLHEKLGDCIEGLG